MLCCSMGMQHCAAEDNLDMVSASMHVLALLGGGVCAVAGQHSFIYFEVRRSHSSVMEVAFPLWVWGAYPPFSSVQCCRWREPCACGY